MRPTLFAGAPLACALLLASAASAQDTCIDAGIDPGCCEIVCNVNPLCCAIAWDAACEQLLVELGCGCSGSTPIKGDSTTFDTTAATRDLNLAGICDPGPFGNDTVFNYVVFTWTAPANGRYTLSTCNTADFDTRIAIADGCNPFNVFGCNDDGTGCATFTSELTVELSAGTSYYIYLGGYSEADIGTGTLSIAPFEVSLSLNGAHFFPELDAGAGKWYASYTVSAGATWLDIRDKVAALGGMLASPKTVEDSFTLGTVVRATGGAGTCAFGLSQDVNAKDYLEPAGGWRWADGTTVDYAKWNNGEPNDGGGNGENHAQLQVAYFGEFWNDLPVDAAWNRVVVEFPAAGHPDFAAPANDERKGAVAIEQGALTTVSFVGASTSAGSLCEDPMFYDRWYTFMPEADDTYKIVVCGNNFVANVAIEDATGELVACTGGACSIEVDLLAGMTYTLQVGSPTADSAGNPTILVEPAPVIVSLDAISVNFVGGTFNDGGDGGRCDDTADFPAGAGPWGTLHWSNLVGKSSDDAAAFAAAGNGDAPTALKDGTATATGASVTWSVGNTWRIFSFPANDSDRMRRGYLDTNGFPEITVTVNDLSYEQYTAVVYFGADGGDRAGSVSVNGAAPIFFLSDPVPGGNFNPLSEATATDAASAARASYAVFRGLTGPSCAMTIVENGPNLGFMGFQIIKESAVPACPADLDGDGAVNAADLAALLSSWGTAGADLDGDGSTNAADLAALLSAWGPCQ